VLSPPNSYQLPRYTDPRSGCKPTSSPAGQCRSAEIRASRHRPIRSSNERYPLRPSHSYFIGRNSYSGSSVASANWIRRSWRIKQPINCVVLREHRAAEWSSPDPCLIALWALHSWEKLPSQTVVPLNARTLVAGIRAKNGRACCAALRRKRKSRRYGGGDRWHGYVFILMG
jgi:hypothetical protein